MKLNLTRISSLREVREEFSKEFPFLKIEFFTSAHKPGKGSSFSELYHSETILSEINPSFKDQVLEFQPSDTVAHLEQKFQKAGLPIQVFRKAGKIWLETIQTDHLSLEVQNKMGKETTIPFRINPYTLFL